MKEIAEPFGTDLNDLPVSNIIINYPPLFSVGLTAFIHTAGLLRRQASRGSGIYNGKEFR